MGLIPKSLSSLLVKNLFLKQGAMGSSLAELIIPVIFFFILSSLQSIFSQSSNIVDHAPVPYDSTPMTVSVAAKKLCPGFNTEAPAFIPKNHPLSQIIQTLIKQHARNPETLQFQEFETIEEAESRLKSKMRQYDINVIFEFPPMATTPSYSTMSDDDITNLTSPPQWEYTLHPAANDFQSDSNQPLYNFYQHTPNIPSGIILAANVIANQAILRHNGLYNDNYLNSTSNGDNIKTNFMGMATLGYQDDAVMASLNPFLSTLAVLGFLPSIFSIVAGIVSEKESCLKQTLIISGAKQSTLYLSWFIFQYLFSLPTLCVMSWLYQSKSAPNLSISLPFIAFSMYYLAFVGFCVLMSSFFSKVKSAQITAAFVFLGLTVIGCISSLLPTSIVTIMSLFSTQSMFGNINTVLLSINQSMQGGDVNILDFLTTPTNNGFTLYGCLLTSLIQIIFYFLLTIYIDNVIPGDFNNPLPLYYPFLREYWFGKSNLNKNSGMKKDDDNTGYDPTTGNTVPINPFIQPLSRHETSNVSIRIRNVIKSFQNNDGTLFNAVDGLCTDMIKGQIFSILGHNGAGKSTLISCISGLYHQNSGSIELYDRNGNQIDIMNPSGSIGICPQYNALYPKLSINQHMTLFSAIKQQAMGLTIPQDQIDDEINHLLSKLKLGPDGDGKEDALIETLSGGQKRKVCLALALLHKPSILILDEPSSGTDIAVQRQIWSLLGESKQDAAILLSSHHLEESEIGDRIGIMVKGQMMCCGSSMFLKKQFGVGYHLSLEKLKVNDQFDRITPIDTNSNPTSTRSGTGNDKKTFGSTQRGQITTLSGQKLMSILQPHYHQSNIPPLPQSSNINDIDVKLTPKQLKLLSIMTLHSDNQSSLHFSIPYSFGDELAEILRLFDSIKTALNIIETALSITSLEDIFMMANNGSIDSLTNANDDNDDDNNNFGLHGNTTTSTTTLTTTPAPNNNDTTNENSSQLKLNTSIWDQERTHVNPTTLQFIQFNALFKKRCILQLRDWKSLLRLFALPLILCFFVSTSISLLLEWPFVEPNYHGFPDNTPIYYSKFQKIPDVPDLEVPKWIAGNDFAKNYSTYPGSKPIPHVTDAFLGGDPIQLYNWNAFQYGLTTLDLSLRSDRFTPRFTTPIIFTVNPSQDHFSLEAIIYHNMTSYYSSYSFVTRLYETIASVSLKRAKPVVEKFNEALTIKVKYQSLPAVESIFTSKCIALGVILLMCLLYPPTLINQLVIERAERILHLHRISGVSTFAYWGSYWLFDLIIYSLMCTITVLSLLIFDLPRPPLDILVPALAVYGPTVILFVYFFSLSFNSPSSAQTMISVVLILGPMFLLGALTVITAHLGFADVTKFYSFALIIPSTGIIWSLLNSLASEASRNDQFHALFGKWISFVPFYFIAFWIGLGINNRHWFEELFTKTIAIKKRDEVIDPDVLEQEKLIKNVAKLDSKQYPLVINGMRKVFGGFTAVNNIYFSMKRQECLGLLGSNGAGKSTLLALITSHLIPSQSVESQQSQSITHTAFINGHDIVTENQACWRELGFCPQFDAVNLGLTARETLTMYCNFRGITLHNATLFVSDLLNALGLEYAADRSIEGYSLGMRRRLSIGVALVGNPAVVLIDEGTTGVDPISRSNIRLLLQQTCRNRALLITSHNLEEVEALADTIGIMSRGEMKTWGTKSALKRKLANHYQLHLHIKSGFEHVTCIHALSILSNVEIPKELEALMKQVEGANETVTEAKTTLSPLESLLSSKSYSGFLTQCKIGCIDDKSNLNNANGCYINECRHTAGVLNISKDLYTLPDLFSHAKELQSVLPNIEAYSCSQIPLDQVFLEIVKKDEYFNAQKQQKKI